MNIKDWKKKMNNANLNQCDEVLDKICWKNAINALKLHDVPEIKELYGLD